MFFRCPKEIKYFQLFWFSDSTLWYIAIHGEGREGVEILILRMIVTGSVGCVQEDTKKVDKTSKRLKNARLDMDSCRGRYTVRVFVMMQTRNCRLLI